MAQKIIDIGAVPDDGQGDPLRTAFDYTNENFSEIYTAGPVGSNVRITNNTITTTVTNGNLILSPSGIGKIQMNNTVLPRIDDVYSIGSPQQRFNSIYIGTGGIYSSGGFTLTGNITGGNIITPGQVIAGGNITGGNILTNGDVITHNLITLGVVSAAGNIYGSNLEITNHANVGSLDVNGDTVIYGNLTVEGNVSYINITNLNVQDPIIGIGRGANNTPLTVNDGLDRGEQLWYYTTQERSAFIGYQNSTGKIIAATNVSIANEVVTVNNFGTVQVGNLETAGISSSGNIIAPWFVGNISGNISGNITVPGGNTQVIFNNNGIAGASANLTFDQATDVLEVDGNISVVGSVTVNQTLNAETIVATSTFSTAGNVIAGHDLSATGDVFSENVFANALISTSGNIVGNFVAPGSNTQILFNDAGIANATSGVTFDKSTGIFSVVGNVAGGNITTAGIVSATGNVYGGNFVTSGVVTATGGIVSGSYISAVGNLFGGNVSVTGNVYAASLIGNISGNISGNITVPGANTQVIFNDDGIAGASAGITFDKTANLLSVTGTVQSPLGRFNSVYIPSDSSNIQLLDNNSISGWYYTGISKSVSAQETTGTGVFFSTDGLNMYIVGQGADTVFQYKLTIAWDVSTAAFTVGDSLSIAAQDGSSMDIYFTSDGITMFMTGDATNGVYKYTLGTAWQINTGVYTGQSYIVTTQESSPGGIWFKPDGLQMYLTGANSDLVQQYTLSVAWDITTSTFTRSYNIAPQETAAAGLQFNSTGTAFYLIGAAGDDISQYNLSIAWDISTAFFFNKFYVGFQDTNPQGLFIEESQNKIWMIGTSLDSVFQYNTMAVALNISTQNLYSNSYTRFGGNVYTDQGVAIEGALAALGGGTFSGTLTAASTLIATATLSLVGVASGSMLLGTNITTASATIATAMTTGNVTMGGTLQTGFIQIGQSTANQTVAIATGAVGSGNTKTINIGTTGVANSITNIAIGSSVSGALGNIILQTPNAIIGQTATAVNYHLFAGAATTKVPTYSVAGTDTNISMLMQPKGTGAIDLAAGSSGINISNGGTVTALTRTASGTNYTSIPSIAISAPTTAGGIQATANAIMQTQIDPVVVSGGTGYTLGDVLTIVGGTAVTLGSFIVSAVSGNVITAATRNGAGGYTVLPTNPVSVTGGTGSGATFNITAWQLQNGVATITNAGSGYVEQPTITFSGGGGSGAAAYATVGSSANLKVLGANLDIYTPGGNRAFQFYDSGGTGNAFWSAQSGGSSPFLFAQGGTNITGRITSNGTGSIAIYSNGGLAQQFNVAHTANAVNFIQATGAATGNAPALSAQGTDASMNLTIAAKGSGSVSLPVNRANYLTLAGTASTGNSTSISAVGSDTNIDINLAPKGSGAAIVTNTVGTTTAKIWANTITAPTADLEFQRGTDTTWGNDSFTDYRIRAISGNLIIQSKNNATSTLDLLTVDETNSAIRVSPVGVEQFRVAYTANAVNYVQATGAATAAPPAITAQGSDTNIRLNISSRGTESVDILTNNTGTRAAKFTYTASSVNWVQMTGNIANSAPSYAVAGSDTNIDLNIVSKGTGVINLNTGAGTQVRIIDSGGTAVNRIHLQGQATGFLPIISSRGSDTNLGMSYSTQGTGAHDFYTAGTSFSQQLKVAHTANAVNYVQVTGAVTGSTPTLSVQGSDADVGMLLQAKGARGFTFQTRGGGTPRTSFIVADSGVASINYIQAQSNTTGNGPVLSALGTDTNIDLNLTPKGTGNVLTGANISATGNVTASWFIGNISGNITGNITSPGSNTQVIFNDSGIANAVSAMTFNKSTNIFSVTGNIQANNIGATTSINIGGDLVATVDDATALAIALG